jgi:glycosyltransferase involved in cell wall biosynthesis
MTPAVSIVVPVFNAEPYLPECLASLQRQSLGALEFLLVDDGSTDGSRKLLDEFAAADPRAKVVAKTNSGLGHTLNVGIDQARGEYVGIVEPDDYVATAMFETLHRAATRHHVDIAKADFVRFHDSRRRRRFRYCRIAKERADLYDRVLEPAACLALFRSEVNTWSGIYRRDFLDSEAIRHHETPGASYQDTGFFFQTLCRARRVYLIPQAVYCYRVDNPSSSVKRSDNATAIRNEMRFIGEFIDSDRARLAVFEPALWYRKFVAYLYSYERASATQSLSLLKELATEFRGASERGLLDPRLFSPTEWACLQDIMRSPQRFHDDYFAKVASSPLQVARRKVRRLASWVTDYGPGRCAQYLARASRSGGMPKRVLPD